MIEDARHVPSGATVPVDLCIIGAGAAGISLALQFIGAGKSVLVAESGGLRAEAATQALYAGEVASPELHSSPDKYRQRRFGGSTTTWGGRCIPFDPIDFEARPWVPDSGWPIGFGELAPFYERANLLCDAGRFAYTADAAGLSGARPIIAGFDSARVSTDTLERSSLPTDFGARHRAALWAARDVRVVLHANCVELETDPQGRRIELAHFRTLRGGHFRVRARRFVLATGGLEVPRLLLASRRHRPEGLGNRYDLVGRYYMCHIAGTIGTLTTRAAVWPGYERTPDGVYARRRFALTAAVQRELGVGNFIARLHFPRPDDPSHRTGFLSLVYLARGLLSYEYGKRLEGHYPGGRPPGLIRSHLANVLRDPVDTAATGLHWLLRHICARRKYPSVIVLPKSGRFTLDFHAEQLPNRDSRVMLAERRDALGMPCLRIDWRHSQSDVETVRRALAVLAEAFHASGVARLEYAEDDIEREVLRDGAYGGHHIGTARMSADPRRGVVDPDGRVHDLDNLYIAGSAVFASSSQANPTLTIVALALRLAAHLERLDAQAA